MQISDTHYIIIDCKPGSIRPNNVLEMVLHDDLKNETKDTVLTIDDFLLESKTFGEFKYNILKEKEQLFEENLPKIVDALKGLYNCGIIRYTEWSPN
jgi:hypothetical protein